MVSFKEYFNLLTESNLVMTDSKLLGLQSSMVRLPMNPPYGFWMDKHGNWIAVPGMGGHESVGMELLTKAGLNPKKVKSVYDTLMKAGWVRLVCSKNNNALFFEIWPGIGINSTQKRNMKFIQEFYDFGRLVEG